MDADGDTNMQHTESSDEHVAADGGHIPSNQETAPVWTSPPVPRPPPHLIAGKVMRTIFHWETGTWQHEHEKAIFDWGLLDSVRLRVSCSLPPPPIPRPFTDRAGGKAVRLSFYWEIGRWEHEWESGHQLLARPGALTGPSFLVMPQLPPLPPSLIGRIPPHPIHGEVMGISYLLETEEWALDYEDGTRVPAILGPS